MIRNGIQPIQIPPVVRSGPADLVNWLNMSRTCMQQLRDRKVLGGKSATGGGGYTHPFQLFGKTDGGACLLHTWEGACTTNGFVWTSTSVYGVTRELVPSIGSGVLIGPEMPIGNAGAGYLTLSASTTYGIWLKIGALDNFYSPSVYNPIAGLFPNSANVHFQAFSFSGATVEASSTNTETTDAATEGSAEFLAIYLGKVVVDADGVGTITQYRKSDVTLCEPLMTSPIVVSTDTNDISVGTDGGALYVTP